MTAYTKSGVTLTLFGKTICASDGKGYTLIGKTLVRLCKFLLKSRKKFLADSALIAFILKARETKPRKLRLLANSMVVLLKLLFELNAPCAYIPRLVGTAFSI